MKLNDIYAGDGFGNNKTCSRKTRISFEIFPPKNGEEQFPELFAELDILAKFKPSLVSLTYGAGGSNNNSMQLVKTLSEKFNIMPHFTCVCNDKADVENHIKEIADAGIQNILALRGDIPQDKTFCKNDFKYANELVEFIKAKTDLAIGVAGYPEGHIEASSLEVDIENLKRKVDAGASAIFTQLFFVNDKFYNYVEKVHSAGIDLPIVAGIMPVISFNQVEKMISLAKITVPDRLKDGLEKYKNSSADIKNFGVEFALEQCRGLMDNGVAGLHFYTLNKAFSTAKILENII